jgi:DNA-binding transcriptional ArsR family regulator
MGTQLQELPRRMHVRRAKPFAMSLNAVSKHVRVLERARLVRRRYAGREHLLSVNLEPLDEAASWLSA